VIVDQLPGGGFLAPAPFKIYFKNGGAQTFVSLFFPLHEVVKKHYIDSSREFQARQRIMMQRERMQHFCLSFALINFRRFLSICIVLDSGNCASASVGRTSTATAAGHYSSGAESGFHRSQRSLHCLRGTAQVR
jgi:hypothetical protein